MKKLMAISLIASSVLFASSINLGVTQSNTDSATATTATYGSDIKQGTIEIYGNSYVNGLIANTSNRMSGIILADNNSTIEQGNIQISHSNVRIRKNRVYNKIAGRGAYSQTNSEISQGKWKIVAVRGSVKSTYQSNTMNGLERARNNSKITQGDIEVGSVYANITTSGSNSLQGSVSAYNNSDIDQGSIIICGNTNLPNCGN